MTVKLLIITIVAYLEVAKSQYYAPSAPSSYQPYNYYPSASTSTVSTSISTPTFALPAYYPTMFTQPQSSPPSFYATPFSSMSVLIPISAPAPLSNAPMPTCISLETPTHPPPMYASPNPYATTPPVSNYAMVPAIPTKHSSSTVATKPTTAPPKCKPSTSIAYLLTTPLESQKAVVIETAKEIIAEKLPPLTPSYPCPFCTGFANVSKNPKVLPPPPCSSVLPGILDKIPTIKIPDEFKIKDLSKFAKPMPLLADLSGKLRFDENLLDGFLTGLGLGKCND